MNNDSNVNNTSSLNNNKDLSNTTNTLNNNANSENKASISAPEIVKNTISNDNSASNLNTTINKQSNNSSQNNLSSNISNSPNSSVSNNASPDLINNSGVKIEETSVTKAKKGTIVVATINNGTVNVLTDKMPDPIDIAIKKSKVITKNGKRVHIMTKRELITNIILSFFFVLALCGIGYGTYYYLFRNNPRNFETKNITIEYGDEIPASVRNYINLTDISEPDYTLDLSAVKNEIGTYVYKVSYGNTTKTGNITINDTKAPEITFKDVKEFDAGTLITKDMLVESCTDLSECTYDLTAPVDTTNPGEVIASITAKDNLGNTKDYTITLTINEKLINMVCSYVGITTDENGKTLLANNKYNLYFNTSKILKNGTLHTLRTYLSDSDYTTIKDSLSAGGFKLEDINRRASKDSEIDNVANLTSQDEIKTHLENNGYDCNIGNN